MNTNANESSHCPCCGRPLPAGVLSGLCPACLLVQGEDTESAAAPGRQGFEAPSIEIIANLFPQLEVHRLLGAGGMGAVYRARQPALDRIVALKVLPVGRGTGSAERFNREARALARLSHPNIVSVHEFGQVEGLHYFVMEFVDGTNLRQLEKSSRLSSREALQIIPQICDALQYAHDEGIVHRDIKPENVLIDRKGRVKIADFGLAKILDPDPAAVRLTVEGQVMGTPHYMAPEQLERPLSVDHRADIYALGVVFYEMLTGDLPIGKFAPPSRKVELDVRLDEIVLRALENDPNRRYQRASEVKSEIQTVADMPPQASQSNPIEGTTAVRRALDPRFPASPRGARPSLAWWQSRSFRGWILAAMGLLVAIWMLFQNSWFRSKVVDLLEGRSQALPLVARPDPESGSWKAQLPNGSQIEFMGVSRTNAAPNQWWRPDGKPIETSALEIQGPADMIGEYALKAQLAFRVTGSPSSMETVIYDFSPSASVSAGGTVWENGVAVGGGWPIRAGWVSAAENATLRFGFRYEPWRTIVSERIREPAQTFRETVSGDPKWIASFNHFSDDGTNTLVTVVLSREPKDWRMRVVAMDIDGVEHSMRRGMSTPVADTETWTCTFPDLTLNRVEEFRVQVQRVHWVEFRNVALRPAGPIPEAASPAPTIRVLEQPGLSDELTGALYAQLPGGGRIELVAVGNAAATRSTWWRPNGAPVTDSVFEVRGADSLFAPTGHTRDLIFRSDELPESTTLVSYDFAEALNQGGGGVAYQDGQPIPNTRPVRVAWRPETTKVDLRLAFGIGEWMRLSSHFPPGRSATWNRERGLPDLGHLLHDLVDTKEGVRITFGSKAHDPNWQVRLVAMDSSGTEQSLTSASSTPASTSRVESYVLRDVAADSIREIRVYVRPLHWVRFRDVALAAHTPVPRDESELANAPHP